MTNEAEGSRRSLEASAFQKKKTRKDSRKDCEDVMESQDISRICDELSSLNVRLISDDTCWDCSCIDEHAVLDEFQEVIHWFRWWTWSINTLHHVTPLLLNDPLLCAFFSFPKNYVFEIFEFGDASVRWIGRSLLFDQCCNPNSKENILLGCIAIVLDFSDIVGPIFSSSDDITAVLGLDASIYVSVTSFVLLSASLVDFSRPKVIG